MVQDRDALNGQRSLARDHVVRHFSLSAMAQHYRELYEQCAAHRRPK